MEQPYAVTRNLKVSSDHLGTSFSRQCLKCCLTKQCHFLTVKQCVSYATFLQLAPRFLHVVLRRNDHCMMEFCLVDSATKVRGRGGLAQRVSA